MASEEEQLLEEELKLVRRLNEQASGSTKIDMNVKVNILHIHFKSMAVQKLMMKSCSTSSQRRLRPQRHL